MHEKSVVTRLLAVKLRFTPRPRLSVDELLQLLHEDEHQHSVWPSEIISKSASKSWGHLRQSEPRWRPSSHQERRTFRLQGFPQDFHDPLQRRQQPCLSHVVQTLLIFSRRGSRSFAIDSLRRQLAHRLSLRQSRRPVTPVCALGLHL
jgi:hypothetical protein